jgi:hypothetical protein
MAENKDSFENVLTNLALITDGVQSLYPNSKSVLIYELNQTDFSKVRVNFKNIKLDETQIKLEISGTEVIFILEGSFKEEPKQVEVKETRLQKFKKFLFKKSS